MARAMAAVAASVLLLAASASALNTLDTVAAIATGSQSKPYSLATLNAALQILPAIRSLLAGNVTFFAPTDEAFAALAQFYADRPPAVPEIDLASPDVGRAILRFHIYDPFDNYTAIVPSKLEAGESQGLTSLNPQVAGLWWRNNSGIADLTYTSPNVYFPQVYPLETIRTDSGLLIPVGSVMVPPYCADTSFQYDTSITESFRMALERTGLMAQVEALDEVTIFVPSNQVFSDLAQAGNDFEALPLDQQTAILRDHIVPGERRYLSSAANGTLTALSGAQIPVVVSTNGTVTVGGALVQPSDRMPDYLICNGVYHVVDGVVRAGEGPSGTTASGTVPATSATSAISTRPTTAATTAATSAASTVTSASTSATTSASASVATSTSAQVTTSRPASAIGRTVGLEAALAVAAAGVAALLL
ncbi:hypothetical protein DFJ74DRAFT_768670 [Hyaloraphidium curvatum]|nr:hypothetical protein DFJ74DRAFT_768670 [Hyaloraphidium curvatum]